MLNKTNHLAAVDLFQGLSEAQLHEIEHKMRMVKHSAGHHFYMPDDPGEVLFILKEGRVQLYRMSPEGRKLVVAVLQQGAVFGHMALVGQGLHNTYAEALGDCKICVWSREEVEAWLLRNPHMALRFLDIVGRRLIQAEQRLTEFTFKRIPARLAGLLLEFGGQNGELSGFTHQQLADMLGTYRETVTQILNDFKNRGMIHISRKRIRIVDDVLLAEAAEEN